LLAGGAVGIDPLGIGLHIGEDYSLIDVSLRPSRRVRAIGPLARASFWECIAIPDIRLQAQDLAQIIAVGATEASRDSDTLRPSGLQKLAAMPH
jgi:uncharacterized NAD(P)/FAD-binding protein YdhS